MTDSSNAKKLRYPIDMDEQLKSGSDEKTASPSEGESQGASIHRGTQSNPILMTPELFEKLYPAPYTAATGRCSDLRSSLGNPSPLSVKTDIISSALLPYCQQLSRVLWFHFSNDFLRKTRALVGLLVGLTPLACDQMGWRGAGGNGAASMSVSVHLLYHISLHKAFSYWLLPRGAFYFVGGLLLLISGILDFILGNTFLFVVFASYGKLILDSTNLWYEILFWSFL